MDKAYRRWLKKWPHACPRCAGTGTIYFPGNWDEPPSLEACSLCTEEGKCPRCGKVVEAWLDGDEIKVCPHCGWDMADEKTHGPQPPECLCHEFIEEPEYEPAR
jgi:ribosomal protein S27AE